MLGSHWGILSRNDMLFLTLEHETWLCFSPSTAFKCVCQILCPQPLTTSLEDPVGFQSGSALRTVLLWQWTHLQILKSPAQSTYRQQSHSQSQLLFLLLSPELGRGACRLFYHFCFGSSRRRFEGRGGFKEKRKVSFCGFIFRFGRLCKLSVPCTSLTWVMFSRDQLLWYLPSSCVQKCILQCLSPGRSGYLKDGRSPASLCDMTFPWKCMYPCWELRLIHWLFSSPSWVVFRLLQEKSRHLPLSSHVLADSRGCKSSFPEDPLLQANVAQWTSSWEVSFQCPSLKAPPVFVNNSYVPLSLIQGTVKPLLPMRKRGEKPKQSFPSPQASMTPSSLITYWAPVFHRHILETVLAVRSASHLASGRSALGGSVC